MQFFAMFSTASAVQASPWKVGGLCPSSHHEVHVVIHGRGQRRHGPRAPLGSAHFHAVPRAWPRRPPSRSSQRGHEPRDALDHRLQLAHLPACALRVIGAFHHGQHERDGRAACNLVGHIGPGNRCGALRLRAADRGCAERRDTIFDSSLASTATSLPRGSSKSPLWPERSTVDLLGVANLAMAVQRHHEEHRQQHRAPVPATHGFTSLGVAHASTATSRRHNRALAQERRCRAHRHSPWRRTPSATRRTPSTVSAFGYRTRAIAPTPHF